MSHKNFLLQRHSLANERVAGDLAPIPDSRPFLDFDERPDFHVIADLTAVQIGEAIDAHPFAQLHVGRNQLKRLPGGFPGFSHAQTSSGSRTIRASGAFVREVMPLSWISIAAPLRFKEVDAASRIFTSSRPRRPLVKGLFPLRMQSRKC